MKETVNVECRICNDIIPMMVNKDDIKSSSSGTFNIIFVHGDPPHGINVYIDRNLTVRGIEYPDMFNIGISYKDIDNTTEYISGHNYDIMYSMEQSMFMIRTIILSIIDNNSPISINSIYERLILRKNIISSDIDIRTVIYVCRELESLGIIRRPEKTV